MAKPEDLQKQIFNQWKRMEEAVNGFNLSVEQWSKRAQVEQWSKRAQIDPRLISGLNVNNFKPSPSLLSVLKMDSLKLSPNHIKQMTQIIQVNSDALIELEHMNQDIKSNLEKINSFQSPSIESDDERIKRELEEKMRKADKIAQRILRDLKE